jgi:uncharacterized membrane protein
MTLLIAAALFFLAIHLLVSGTAVRGGLVRMMGEGPYMGLFTLASFAGLGALIWGYAQARGLGEVYWQAPAWGRDLQYVLTLLAFLFIVVGLTTPNPTSVKQEGVLERPDAINGMLRITRHPFLWGVALWAAGHLLLNGDTPSVILFGTMLFLAIFGTVSIDAKRRKALGETYAAFTAKTSNIPFAAILTGKQPLKIGELGWWRIVLALVLWGLVAWFHGAMFGAPAIVR